MLKIIRSMRQLDFEQLMHVFEQSNREKGQHEYPKESAQEQLRRVENEAYTYLLDSVFANKNGLCAVWEAGGRYLAALYVEPYNNGLLITSLETLPEARNRGHAKKLVHAVVQYLQAHGSCVIYSHVEKRNAPSLAVHKACGFLTVLQYAAFLDGSVSHHYLTLCYRSDQ